MPIKKFHLLLVLVISLFVVGACSDEPSVNEEQQTLVQQQLLALEEAVEKKNKELKHEPVQMRGYAEIIGAQLIQPSQSNFAANGAVTIEGIVEEYEQFISQYAKIQVVRIGDNEVDGYQNHSVPLKDGKFKLDAKLFKGEGLYAVFVSLPANDRPDDYYYETMYFTVYNVNPNLERDITYTPEGLKVGLSILEPHGGLINGNEPFTLKGKVDPTKIRQNDIMIQLAKNGVVWTDTIPVENGEFKVDIPIFFGKGKHQLFVSVPDMEIEDWFNEGTAIIIDNDSDLGMETIIYNLAYDLRGVTIESPEKGGGEADSVYRLKGFIDKDAPFAKETTHLHITTSKNNEYATYVIPVIDFMFDDEFYLRFGSGTYLVTVSVPDSEKTTMDMAAYTVAAHFLVNNSAKKDQRDTLPSRGVQSEDPVIIALANELTKDKKSARDKAKAIYEYTAKTISYDVDKLYYTGNEWDDSALKTLRLKSGMCMDYSYLAIALLRAAGMEARLATGTVGEGIDREYHAWVEVWMNGLWLTMDPTWGSGYVEDGVFVADYTEDYFDPSAELFESHTWEGIVY
ncbi:transglutaminase-like domain-containing protein [Sporosarcina sp. FSL W8-0480]|uniref:transglutaminase-like domain-containing protein n=1 Tax=Sporosarcina sp. FSL W8-0480 TaxID=2954701 RepID=UPI0030DD5950